MLKIKTTIDEQINLMKKKRIRFNLIAEKKAKDFIKNKTYYFKIASYSKNFDYNKDINGVEIYKDLDFAYLKELSKIDMYLRYVIMELTLDIEHSLKKWLVQNVTNDINDDGYTIVNLFLQSNSIAYNHLKEHAKSVYCEELINKYIQNMPVWVYVEVATFGDFLFFIEFYCKHNNIKSIIDKKILNQIKTLRNASAHNNCLINNIDKLVKPNTTINIEIKNWCYKQLPKMNTNYIDRMLRKQFIYDFVGLIYAYDVLAEKKVKSKKFFRLYMLFYRRIRKHKNYFNKNQRLKSAYKFVFSLIESIYNKNTIENYFKRIKYMINFL